MAGGTLWNWGLNHTGELGDSTTVVKSSPIQVGTLSTWSVISTSGSRNDSVTSLAIKTDGTLWAWGGNGNGQIGDGTVANKSSPVQIGTLASWLNAQGGYNHSVAVKTDSTLWAWGRNRFGELGDSTSVDKSSPIQVGTLANWSSVIGAGYQSSFAIKTDSTMWAWGYNRQGQGGVSTNAGSTTTGNSSPIQIGTMANWGTFNVNVNTNQIAAVKTDSTLWQWGIIDGGNIGVSSPTQIGTLANWRSVSIGQDHKLALKTDSTLWAWGYSNTSGQFGDGTATSTAANRSSPIQIGTLAKWSTVAAGQTFSLARQTDSSLWSWGLGTSGQLGSNAASSRSSPVQVGTIVTWSSIDAGGDGGMAIQTTAPVVTANGGFFNFM